MRLYFRINPDCSLAYVFILSDFALQAISNPTKDNLQEKAWLAVCPLVGRLKNYFEFANKLGETDFISPAQINLIKIRNFDLLTYYPYTVGLMSMFYPYMVGLMLMSHEGVTSA